MTTEPDTIDFSQIHSDAIESMKSQLLIVLVNRLGGSVAVPCTEVDLTEPFNLAMRLDVGRREFHFTVLRKPEGKKP